MKKRNCAQNSGPGDSSRSFIENRVYKDIEDIEDIEGVYAAVREAIGKFTPVSTTARALDRGMNELNRSAPEIRDAARSLLTTIFRSFAFEHYGPSREMIARNLDAIGHGPMQHQQVVKSLLSAIRHELTASGRMAAVEDIITVDNLTREDMDRLLDIPILRISRYGIDRAEEEMREIEGQLRTVLHPPAPPDGLRHRIPGAAHPDLPGRVSPPIGSQTLHTRGRTGGRGTGPGAPLRYGNRIHGLYHR